MLGFKLIHVSKKGNSECIVMNREINVEWTIWSNNFNT